MTQGASDFDETTLERWLVDEGYDVQPEPEVLAEGKTKRIIDLGEGVVRIESKDDVTAGDGAKHEVIPGKGWASNVTTGNIFRLLAAHGIPNHYVGPDPESNEAFIASKLTMIPLEVVIRGEAGGSFTKRHPEVAKGDLFQQPVMELYDKRGYNGVSDPLVIIDYQHPNGPQIIYRHPSTDEFLGVEPLAGSHLADVNVEVLTEISKQAKHSYEVLRWAWGLQGLRLQDMKVEFGFDSETEDLMLGDVIDNDSWRLVDAEGNHLDKQLFRDGTASGQDLLEAYFTVARLSYNFDALRYGPLPY